MTNSNDPPDNEGLDPLAQRLLDLDAALENGLDAVIEISDTDRVADETAGDRDVDGLRPHDCLQMIEAIRVISPSALSDVFDSALHTADIQADQGLAAKLAGRLPSQFQAGQPTTIGRFQLIRQLGKGGYGVVFLAHDPTLHRDIALKVPRPEVLMTSKLRDRFLREAEAAAALDHPNIVPIYEAGTAGPVSYIATAYCSGGSLSQWMQERGPILEPHLAAKIVATLCEAVQHAHDRGILHLDIKPGNVLIDETALNASSETTDISIQVRLADFGLARALLDSSQLSGVSEPHSPLPSHTLEIVGTPAYMAPEQAANDQSQIGPQTDVYALAASLYQLLTGRPPMVRSSPVETLNAILTEVPDDPRTHQRTVPADLNAVCMKALSKSPSDRYASAQAFADDLKRFLAGHQVEARPIRRLGKIVRWCRRNPTLAATASTALVAVLVAAMTAAIGWWATAQSLAREQAALAVAEAAYQETREAVDQYYISVSENKLLRMPGMTELRKELLESALGYYSKFAERRENDPSAANDLRQSYNYIARIHRDLGNPFESIKAYGRLLELNEQAAAHELDVERRWQLRFAKATILRQIGDLHVTLGNLADAKPALEEAVEIHRNLIDRNSQLSEHRFHYGQLLNTRARMVAQLGDVPEAEENYAAAAANFQVLLDSGDTIEGISQETLKLRLAQSRGNRAAMLNAMGRGDEANEILVASARTFQELADEYPNDPTYQENVGKVHAQLSLIHSTAKDFAAALEHITSAMQAFDKIAMQFPRIARYQRYAAEIRREAATIYAEQGQITNAERLYEQSLDILERSPADGPEDAMEIAVIQLKIGRMRLGQARISEAADLISAAFQALKAYHARRPNDIWSSLAFAESHLALADLRLAEKDSEEATQLASSGLEVLRGLPPPSQQHPAFAEIQADLERLKSRAEKTAP